MFSIIRNDWNKCNDGYYNDRVRKPRRILSFIKIFVVCWGIQKILQITGIVIPIRLMPEWSIRGA